MQYRADHRQVSMYPSCIVRSMLPDQRGSNANLQLAGARRRVEVVMALGRLPKPSTTFVTGFERGRPQVPGKIVLGLQPLVNRSVDDQARI